MSNTNERLKLFVELILQRWVELGDTINEKQLNRVVQEIIESSDLNELEKEDYVGRLCLLFNPSVENVSTMTQVGKIKFQIVKVDGMITCERIDKTGCAKVEKVKLTEELFEQVKEYLAKGFTYIAIEELTGVCQKQVAEIARGKDIINNKYKRSVNSLSSEVIDKVKQLLAVRSPKVIIEQQTGVSRYYINKIEKGEPVPTNGRIKRTNKPKSNTITYS